MEPIGKATFVGDDDILYYDAARSDYSVFADMHALDNNGVCADQHIVL